MLGYKASIKTVGENFEIEIKKGSTSADASVVEWTL